MAVTPSSMLPLGTTAPDFRLQNTVDQQLVSLNTLQSDHGLVVMFICNHCPYVKHILDELLQVAKHYQTQGFKFVAISANDAENYPADAPEKMHELAITRNFCFPYLYDETQEIAQAYRAECTPDFFVFNKKLQCVYRGRFDGSTPGNNTPVTGADLIAALDALSQNKTINPNQHPSLGCNIKWKK